MCLQWLTCLATHKQTNNKWFLYAAPLHYISKSTYVWKMIDIPIESELLKLFYSVPLFIFRFKLRPWQELTYHAQKRWRKKVIRFWALASTFGVIIQIRRVKGSLLTFMVRSPSFSDSCQQTFKETLHRSPPSSWAIRQWHKKVRSTGSVKGQKESERKSISDRYPGSSACSSSCSTAS